MDLVGKTGPKPVFVCPIGSPPASRLPSRSPAAWPGVAESAVDPSLFVLAVCAADAIHDVRERQRLCHLPSLLRRRSVSLDVARVQ